MTRVVAAVIALTALVALTLATLLTSGEATGPWLPAALAFAKIAFVGGVFLELDQSWPGWAALAAGVAAGTLLGAAALCTM